MGYEEVKSFLGNPLVATAIAAIFTYVGWRLGHRRAKPTVWLTAAKQLTWGKADELPDTFEIRYRAQAVKRVIRGTLVLWNAGNLTLESSAVSSHDPLRMVIPDGEFLEAEIIRVVNRTAGLEAVLSEDLREIEVRFEYVDPNEGVTIAFLHTSAQVHPDVRGRIKGHKLRFYDDKPKSLKNDGFISRSRRRTFVSCVLLLLGLTLIGYSTLKLFFPLQWKTVLYFPFDPAGPVGRWMPVAGGVAYVAVACGLLWVGRRKYPKSLEYRSEELTSPQTTVSVDKE